MAASPIPMRTSPTLKTLANGSQPGNREEVGQRAQDRFGDDDAVRAARAATLPTDASAAASAGIQPPFATIAAEVAAGTDGDDRHPGDREIAEDGDEDRGGGRDVDDGPRVADQARRPVP